MSNDSWGRPKQSVYDLTALRQGDLLSIHNELPEEATPEEVDEWMSTDFFMAGKFDPMQMFVVIPAVIQITVFGIMLASFALIQWSLLNI
ncbi:hypothetical protein N9C44_00235 [bacterium]|jgi:hypothetical protein|nr:hypothetical protein [bacterium]|tara:strand:- start:401 stop:670 length:270 start_codon:yes stop_codon:yes gene_type:complete